MNPKRRRPSKKSRQSKAAPAVEFDASLAAQLTAAAPTASLIASLAAQLSASAPQATPDALVRRALDLYQAAQRALATRPFKNRVFGQHRKEGIPNRAVYLDRAERFLRWYQKERPKELRALRAAAGRIVAGYLPPALVSTAFAVALLAGRVEPQSRLAGRPRHL